MGCFESGGEDELHSKRLKVPRKFSDGCNIVNHAPVPRKLRSAIKKRNHESISSPFAGNGKLNQVSNGVGRLKKDVKKPKVNLHSTQGVINKEVLGSITEDEQEVAETLYALAAMLPDTRYNKELPEGKSSPSPEVECSMPSTNVLEKETEIRTTSPQLTAEASKHTSNAEETIKFQSSSDNQLDSHVSMELPIDLNTYNSEVNLTPTAFFKPEQVTDRILENNVVSPARSNLHLPYRISQWSELGRTPAGREKLEIGLNSAATYRMQTEVENKSKEKQTNTSSGSLWPGLTLAGSFYSNLLSPSLELYDDVKYPEWFGNNAFTARTQTPERFAEKNGRVPVVLKNSWKRCCTHVYVCRLIEALKTSERAGDKLLTQSTQTNGSKQRGTHVTDNNLIGTRNDSHIVFSSDSAVERTTNEVRNAIFLHKKLLQDQRRVLSKQNQDFMSFPAQGMINGSSSATKAGQTVEASKKLHFPHITSENQQLSFLLPQNRYLSNSFGPLSSTAAAQQVLLPPRQQQLQRQEIQIWPTQLTSPPYKHGEASASHIPEWQNGGQNGHSLLQSAQTVFPTSRSSLDMQQRLMPAISSSLSGPRVRGQYYRLPDGFEGSGRGLYPNSAPALQMLCNGHH